MSNMIIDKALTFVGKNIKQPLKVGYVNGSIQISYTAHTTITAPTIDGYTFLCWLSSASDGWIGSVYTENAGQPTTNVWNATQQETGNYGGIVCFALYIRSDLA